MRKKRIKDKHKIRGFYLSEVIYGFFGDQDEGRIMLSKMGLQEDTIPFSVATFIRNKRTFWRDNKGNVARISYRLRPDAIECRGSYMKKEKMIRVIREWGSHENKDLIARLESIAIGDLCMHCIYNNLQT